MTKQATTDAVTTAATAATYGHILRALKHGAECLDRGQRAIRGAEELAVELRKLGMGAFDGLERAGSYSESALALARDAFNAYAVALAVLVTEAESGKAGS